MTMKSERIFFAIMVIMAIVLFFTLSSCSMLNKLRGDVSPHADTLIEVPTVTEDIVVPTVVANDIRG